MKTGWINLWSKCLLVNARPHVPVVDEIYPGSHVYPDQSSALKAASRALTVHGTEAGSFIGSIEINLPNASS